MISESKAISDRDNIPLIFRVVISQHLEDFDLYLSLLVQFFLVLKDL